MNIYFAPLEGLTDRTYRRIHSKYFPGVSRYYMPFLSPTQNHCLTKKEQRELPLREKESYEAVPQILTKSAEDFLWAAEQCRERGYSEVNLNAGCPSGTVVSKGKGAGLLRDPDGLEAFLTEVFSRCPLKISVKTRLGMESAEEFPKILEILNQFPISELILHPRARNAFYKGSVDLNAFAYCMDHSKAKLCYNGDICRSEDIGLIQQRFPSVQSVMIGRGLIANPFLSFGNPDRNRLISFHNELLDTYCEVFGNVQNALCRMKEFWHLMIALFDNGEKLGKSLKKTNDMTKFKDITQEILYQLPLREQCTPFWRESTHWNDPTQE